MGAFLTEPNLLWGKTTKIRLQVLQQSLIKFKDLHCASEFAPLLEWTENPDAGQDISEFLGKVWGVAAADSPEHSLQGKWKSLVQNRARHHQTVPIFVRMSKEFGGGIGLEALLSHVGPLGK